MAENKPGNFRKFTSSTGKLILAGKNAKQNEELIKSNLEPEEIVLHTKSAGSPFVVIKGEAEKQDIKEATMLCAKYSQEWKKRKRDKDIEVHMFKGKDIYKDKGMKIGTFGVKKYKLIKVYKKYLI